MRNLKKLLALVLTLALALSLAVPAFAAPISEYPDGAEAEDILAQYGKNEAEYAFAVQMLIDLGIVQGGDGGNLNLGKTLSRAEFVVLLYQAMHSGERIATAEPNWRNRYLATFPDTVGHWAEGEIAWAASTGFVQGNGYGFAPGTEITFNNGIMLVMNAMGYDAIKEGLQNLDGTWVAGYERARDVYLNHAYLEEVMANLTALDDQNRLNRAEAFYLFYRFLVRPGFEYNQTYGSYVQQRTDAAWRWLDRSFGAVFGSFLVVTDGNSWGLPNIPNVAQTNPLGAVPVGAGWAGSVDSDSLDEGRAVIQRPIAWDRLDGHVEAWDTFILSAEDTAAMEIDLHDIGRSTVMLFRHPDRDTDVEWVPGTELTGVGDYGTGGGSRAGQYHRRDISKIYSQRWIQDEPEAIHGLSALNATTLGGAFPTITVDGNNDIVSSQVFIDYDNGIGEQVYSANWLGNGNWGSTGQRNFMNADIYYIPAVTELGYEAPSFVFIEDYRVGKIDEVASADNEWKFKFAVNGSRGEANGPYAYDGEAGNQLPSGEVYQNPYPAKGDLVMVCDIVQHAGWEKTQNDGDGVHNYANEYTKLFQPVVDVAEGTVSRVSGQADAQPGNGTLTLGGETYTMLNNSTAGNWITAFNTADVTQERTLYLWHGFVVDINTTNIPRNYALVTAAGLVKETAYNRNEWEYQVDILNEDGTTEKNLVLNKIVMGNDEGDADELEPGNTPANNSGSYGTKTDLNGAGLFFDSVSGYDIFDLDTDADGLEQVADHIWRYSISGGKITLYEVPMKQKAGDIFAASEKVQATANSRFNETWGKTLGENTYGLRGRGLLLNGDSRIFMKTINGSNGRDVYRVHTTNVPGFTGAFTTETLQSDNDNNGPYARVAYVNTEARTTADNDTHWAVALDWWTTFDKDSRYAGEVFAMLADGSYKLLTSIDMPDNDVAFRDDDVYLRRGDVFTYQSVDNTTDTIENITIRPADALVGKYDGTHFPLVNFDNDGLVDNLTYGAGYYGTTGNNHFMVDATKAFIPSDEDANTAANAGQSAVSGWGTDNSNNDRYGWNLYIFSADEGGLSEANVDQLLVVKQDGTNRAADQRYLASKVENIIDDLDALFTGGGENNGLDLDAIDVDLPIANTDAAKAALRVAIRDAIDAIFAQYGAACSVIWNDDLSVNIDLSGITNWPYDGSTADTLDIDFEYFIGGMLGGSDGLLAFDADMLDHPYGHADCDDEDYLPVTVDMPMLDADIIAINDAKAAISAAIIGDLGAYNANTGNKLLDETAFDPNTDDSTDIVGYLNTYLTTPIGALLTNGVTEGDYTGGWYVALSAVTEANNTTGTPGIATATINFKSDDGSNPAATDTMVIKLIIPADKGKLVASTSALTVIKQGGVALPEITITFIDEWGDADTTVADAVSVAVGGSDSLAGSTAAGVTASSGVAAFDDLELTESDPTDATTTLTFSSTNYADVVVTVTYVAPTKTTGSASTTLLDLNPTVTAAQFAAQKYLVFELDNSNINDVTGLEFYVNSDAGTGGEWKAVELDIVLADGVFFIDLKAATMSGITVNTSSGWFQMGLQPLDTNGDPADALVAELGDVTCYFSEYEPIAGTITNVTPIA